MAPTIKINDNGNYKGNCAVWMECNGTDSL